MRRILLILFALLAGGCFTHDALASPDSFLLVSYTNDVSRRGVRTAVAWYESESNYVYRTAWVHTKDLRPVILESATLHFASVFTAEQLRASKFHVFFHSNLLDLIVDSAGGFNHCIWEGSAANVSVVQHGWPSDNVEVITPKGELRSGLQLPVPCTTKVELTFPEGVVLSGFSGYFMGAFVEGPYKADIILWHNSGQSMINGSVTGGPGDCTTTSPKPAMELRVRPAPPHLARSSIRSGSSTAKGSPVKGGTATVSYKNAFLADSSEEPAGLPEETVRPLLHIERISPSQIKLVWPQGLDSWQLLRHRSVSPGNHIDLSYPEGWESIHVISPAPADSQLILDNSGASEFFRLWRP